jgi:hypothetical protein
MVWWCWCWVLRRAPCAAAQAYSDSCLQRCYAAVLVVDLSVTLVMVCPAAFCTGRVRLHVSAVYGLQLFTWLTCLATL